HIKKNGMIFPFYKYQGPGQDFLLCDKRSMFFKNDTKLIERLCDRRFGIDADGLMLLQPATHSEDDFQMIYFNADGKESTMCGNGGRCVVDFANLLGVIQKEPVFSAVDGKHRARIENGTVHLQMQDV